MSEEQAVAAAGAGTRAGLGRNFRLYATGEAVSFLGDRVGLIALVFLVIHLSRSYPPALALFYVCRLLPSLLGGLVVGVLVDHFNRRNLMIGCDLGRAVLLALVPVFSSLALWSVYPMVVAVYGLTLLFDTAARAALPDVVPEGRMLSANAILNGIYQGADLAYALGGALVYFLKLQLPFYIDAATFLFSASMISLMQFPALNRGPLPNVGEVMTRVREGVDYVLRQPFLKWNTVAFAIAPLGGGVIFVLTPLYATHTLSHSSGLVGPLRGGAFRFSVLEVAIGVGALVGSAMAPRLAARWPRGELFALAMAGLGVTYALFALIANMYAAIAVMVLVGLCNSLFVIAGLTLVQALTPSDVRGRVVAARQTVINSALAAGSALAGVALVVVPYFGMWLLSGAVIAVAGLGIWLRPEVRSQV
jgi:MFS family permease